MSIITVIILIIVINIYKVLLRAVFIRCKDILYDRNMRDC